MITERNLPGTSIPEVPDQLFRSKENDSVFHQSKLRKKLVKIVADTANGDERGDICTDPTHKHPKEWHHGISYPESGGVFVYHLSFPYPEKGTRDDYMMMSIQFVKRALMNMVGFLTYKWIFPVYIPLLFLPWKIKIKILEKALDALVGYAGFVDIHGKKFILEKRYYTISGKELIKGIEIFLKELGINPAQADDVALTLIALVDNDTAYYYRRCDILGETNKELMLKGPAKEILRLLEILARRESRPLLIKKFRQFSYFLTFTLWIPRVKRAFREAVKSMDFSVLGLDDADKYHVSTFGDYKFLGMTREERLKIWPLEQHTLAEIQWDERI